MQQICFEPGSESRERPLFNNNLHAGGVVLWIHHCILYNGSKHTELFLVTANEQFMQQICFEPGSDSREWLSFIINLHHSIKNLLLYIVQSELTHWTVISHC